MSATYVNDLKSFCTVNNVQNQARLSGLFTQPQEIAIPFSSEVSSLALPRVALSSDKHLMYIGRSVFTNIRDHIERNDHSNIIGGSGGGKTHLLAAFTAFHHCLRIITSPDYDLIAEPSIEIENAKPNVELREESSVESTEGSSVESPERSSVGSADESPLMETSLLRVAYLPSCAVAYESNFLQRLIECLQVAFFDAPEVLSQLGGVVSWPELSVFVRSQARRSILFVLDDYNFFADSPPEPSIMETKHNLANVVLTQRLVRAFSTRSTTLPDIIGSQQTFILPSSLPKAEYDAWRCLDKYRRLRLEDQFGIYEAGDSVFEEKLLELEFLTGRNPLIMATLCGYDCNPIPSYEAIETVNAALDMYYNDPSRTNLGGLYVYGELYQVFEHQVRLNQTQAYIDLMTASLTGNISSVRPMSGLYDCRFFYLDRNVLRPLCGFVAHYTSHILLSMRAELFWRSLTPAWVVGALRSDNPSVRGFAFELYVLARMRGLLINTLLLYPNDSFNIVFFEGNFPLQSELPVTPGVVMFWPRKWNLRYVDCVVRVVATFPQPEPLPRLPAVGRRKSARKAAVQTTTPKQAASDSMKAVSRQSGRSAKQGTSSHYGTPPGKGKRSVDTSLLAPRTPVSGRKTTAARRSSGVSTSIATSSTPTTIATPPSKKSSRKRATSTPHASPTVPSPASGPVVFDTVQHVARGIEGLTVAPAVQHRYTVKLIAVQVTLQTPEQHRGSLSFYENDYLHYLLETEMVHTEHHFVWVVPPERLLSGAQNHTLPANPTYMNALVQHLIVATENL